MLNWPYVVIVNVRVSGYLYYSYKYIYISKLCLYMQLVQIGNKSKLIVIAIILVQLLFSQMYIIWSSPRQCFVRTVIAAHVDRLMDIPHITELDWYCFRSYPVVYPMSMMGSRLLWHGNFCLFVSNVPRAGEFISNLTYCLDVNLLFFQ